MTQNKAKNIREKDLSIEPTVDVRPLPSSTLKFEDLEESLGVKVQKKLPTGVRIVIRTVAPLFFGVLFIVLGAISDGSIRYLFFFITALSFAWYVLQSVWLEKEPATHII